nr:dihydrofolate reductase family protein [Microcella alkalica]
MKWYAPGEGESIRLNFVTTLDGRVTGEDGTSGSLTAGADRMILGVIREHADVILVGASTVRAESYRLPRRTPLAIVTSSGDLSGHEFEPREDAPDVLVLAPGSATDAVRRSLRGIRHTILPLPDRSEPATALEILGALRAHGAERMVCEGGPGLAGRLLAAGLVDEVCLTTVPRLGGSGISLLPDDDGAITRWAPRQLLLDGDGVHYARWARRVD